MQKLWESPELFRIMENPLEADRKTGGTVSEALIRKEVMRKLSVKISSVQEAFAATDPLCIVSSFKASKPVLKKENIRDFWVSRTILLLYIQFVR